jgi:hypothetical protein
MAIPINTAERTSEIRSPNKILPALLMLLSRHTSGIVTTGVPKAANQNIWPMISIMGIKCTVIREAMALSD